MRIFTSLLFLSLVACTPSSPETHTATADVDLASVPAMLAAMDSLTDNDLPVDELLTLTNSVPMDDEKQQRFAEVVAARRLGSTGNLERIDAEERWKLWRELQR